MDQEKKLKEVLDGSMFDRKKPINPASYNNADVRDDLLQKQMKMPIEQIAKIANLIAINDKIFVEPSRTLDHTASGLAIPLPADRNNVGMTFDMSLFVNRVIAISKDSTEKTGVKAGDLVLLGSEKVEMFKICGIQVIDTRTYNVTAKIADADFLKSYIWMEAGRIDAIVKSIEERDKLTSVEGMRVRVVEKLKAKIFIYKKSKWVLEKEVIVPGQKGKTPMRINGI